MMLSMDHLTSWINNQQLLSQIEPTDLEAVKDDIILNVFGGFDELLKLILNKYNTLSLLQHRTSSNQCYIIYNIDVMLDFTF